MAEMQQRVVFMGQTQSAKRTSRLDAAASATEAGACLKRFAAADAFDATPLAAAVGADIIPRLLLARSANARDERRQVIPAGFEQSQTDRFTDFILMARDDRAEALIRTLLDRGVTVDSIYVDLLTPTARGLGELWLDDRCGFAEVTLGVSRLTRIMRDLSGPFHQTAARVRSKRNVLLLPLTDEQHTFGLLMVAEFFRRAQWNVACQSPSFTVGDVSAMVAADSLDVVGLSLCHEGRLDELACLIRVIRRSSRNRDIGIIVGGFPFIAHPEYVALVGADASATDARQAPRQAETLIAAMSHL